MAGAWRRPDHPDPVEHAGLGLALWLYDPDGLRSATEAGATRLRLERLNLTSGVVVSHAAPSYQVSIAIARGPPKIMDLRIDDLLKMF